MKFVDSGVNHARKSDITLTSVTHVIKLILGIMYFNIFVISVESMSKYADSSINYTGKTFYYSDIQWYH